MKISNSLMAISAVVLMAACCPCRKSGSSAVPAKDKNWALVSMNGTKQAAGESYNIMFGSDGRFTGKGDCNRLSGSYEMSQTGKLDLKGVASTRMFCPDQAKEDQFVKALGQVDSYSMDAKTNILMLLNDGQALLIFEPAK